MYRPAVTSRANITGYMCDQSSCKDDFCASLSLLIVNFLSFLFCVLYSILYARTKGQDVYRMTDITVAC